ncbi:PLP-dependent aminotransferase family protein [Pedobacter sp. AW1-32]|uniref:aminotransferase-like domain-containing protein n=1 Tax=Pedobacter sp. AW1-32 TaxID=3383026 RepID=UPI003FF0E69B
MNSPVQIPLKSFIQLKPKNGTPVYLQIVFEFIKAIQLGLLPEGTKLPGTRVLCKEFSINRNTLIKAFQDIEAQGFIEIKPNAGTYILSVQQNRIKGSADLKTAETEPYVGFTFKQSSILESPLEVSNLPIQFNDGMPDLRLVHTDVLGKLYVSKLKRQKTSKSWAEISTLAHQNFKLQFTNFLNLTRGIRISSEKLLTTGSHEASLYLVIKLLISPGDKVVVATPSYYLSNMTLSDSGAQIVSIPMNDDGIDTVQLRKICKSQTIRILYLTSGYHYPTTIALSAKNRIEILEMATLYNFVILEDDYDFDFHHDNNPILPLSAFDSNERIVYIGSFARSLPMGFGYGFVVASKVFIQELEKHQNILEPGIDVIKEQVLTDWIQDGEVHRLSKKNRKVYKERRDHFISLLDNKLGGKISYQVPARGLAVWVEWLKPINLVQLQKKCAANGLFLPKTILYQTKNIRATRLGFGNMNLLEMENALELLKKSVEELE